MKLRLVLGVATAALVATALAPATPSQAAPACEANAVCLWTKNNGGGQLYVWRGGYVDVPGEFHDHVYSFRANRGGAFINYNNGTKECRTITPGDYADNYNKGFGSQVDALADHC